MAREEEGGSLDMLLDTLCNTFRGIILIALLLALSVNKKSVELYDKLVKTDDNKSELIRGGTTEEFASRLAGRSGCGFGGLGGRG